MKKKNMNLLSQTCYYPSESNREGPAGRLRQGSSLTCPRGRSGSQHVCPSRNGPQAVTNVGVSMGALKASFSSGGRRKAPVLRAHLPSTQPRSETVARPPPSCSNQVSGVGPCGQVGPEAGLPGSLPPLSSASVRLRNTRALSGMGLREFILPILEPTIKKKYGRIL